MGGSMGKALIVKKGSKKDRETEVLFGLIDLYIRFGKPIGSNTLKENGFNHLSSATIRNYFARLEVEGLLKQHHTSGGRVPTDTAYRMYAEAMIEKPIISKEDDVFLATLLLTETKEVSVYLGQAALALSEMTGCASFIAAPKFDQDFIIKIKLLKMDEQRVVCALLTDFSLIHTEILYLPKKVASISLEQLEDYFHYRLTNLNCPKMTKEEEEFAKQSYNEIVLRHFVNYTNMQFEDIYKAGYTKLLHHAEFHDPLILSNTLSLFENTDALRLLLSECYKENRTQFWIGDDLRHVLPAPHVSSIICVPYKIHNKIVGTIGILGPDRLPYQERFGILERFSKYLSENLTQSMYKFKLTCRQPRSKVVDVKYKTAEGIGLNQNVLIEKKDDI